MQKIIIIGDTCGNFDDVFNKINNIHLKHGPFSAAFCVGNFFGDDSSQLLPYINGEKSILIPTYFLISNDIDTSLIDKLPNKNDGGEICKNLTFLGRFGIKTINKLRIGYLSGLYDENLFIKSPSEIRTILAKKELIKDDNKEEKTLENTKAAKEFRRFYCSNDIKTIENNTQITKIDILLTSEWAKCFHLGILHGNDKLSTIPLNLSLSQFSKLGRSPIVNKLLLSYCPQYHFSGNEDIFFKLSPYKTNENVNYLTRFICLGKIGSDNKQRSIYACNIKALSLSNGNDLLSINSNVKYTKCPYTMPYKKIVDEKDKEKEKNNEQMQLKRVVHKRKFNEMMSETNMNAQRWSAMDNNKQNRNNMNKNSNPPPQNYVCYKCGIPGHYINECNENNKNDNNNNNNNMIGGNRDDYFFEKFGGRRAMKRARKNGGECWFCLGSKKVESHMVISIGDHTYLALAKGSMIFDHLLIIPINHLSSSIKFTPGIRKEINRFLICLQKCYQKENKILLICDRNLPTKYTQHCYLEMYAIDKEKENGLKEVLFEEASKNNITFEEYDNNVNVSCGSFGYLILHDYGNNKKYIHSIKSGMKQSISLNFLRRVISIHLKIPHKSEWTSCIKQNTEEINQTNRIKDKFKPFDWTKAQLTKS